MTQFRLTANAAKTLRAKTLQEPTTVVVPYDDWYVDVKTIRRKKLIIFMHVPSRMVVALPISCLMGLGNWKYGFANFLSQLLTEQHYNKYEIISKEIHSFITESPVIFTKTNCGSVNSHIQQFSFVLEYMSDFPKKIDLNVCYECCHKWTRNLVSIDKSKNYHHPIELFDKLIGFDNKYFDEISDSGFVH